MVTLNVNSMINTFSNSKINKFVLSTIHDVLSVIYQPIDSLNQKMKFKMAQD